MFYKTAKDGPATSNELQVAAMDFLAQREHSTWELTTKLRRKFENRNYCGAALSGVVEKLITDGLLSDDRYSASVVRKLVGRGCGPNRIRAVLQQKGVDYDAISGPETMMDQPVDWLFLAEEAYRKKYRHQPVSGSWEEQRREIAKRLRFMKYRGFDSETCRRVVGADIRDPGDQNDC